MATSTPSLANALMPLPTSGEKSKSRNPVLPLSPSAWLSRRFGYTNIMFKVEAEQETDGRWIAEVPELAGVLVYGTSREEAVTRAQALALHVLAERLEHGEDLPQVEAVFSIVA